MRFPGSLVRLRPAFAAAAVFVAVCTLTRVMLARPETAALASDDLARSVAYGLAFDLAAVAYAVTPLVVCLALAPDRLARTRASITGLYYKGPRPWRSRQD